VLTWRGRVTEDLLATARPSDRLIDEYNIIGQMKRYGWWFGSAVFMLAVLASSPW
jgi:hypothetical protein